MVTGHSLGGALAAFASIDIHKNIAVVSQVYTFGQPRIGNSNMAKFMVGAIPNTYRVIDYADIVPHLPPGVFNFLHYGHEVWYSPRGMQSYKICASEDSNCADSISITSLSTDDHSMSHYLKLKVVSNFYSWFSGMLNYHLRKETDWETVQR